MKRRHTVDVVFALLLFCLFTACVLLVLISGADTYRNITQNMQGQYEERTCLSYITTKLRHYDRAGSVALGRFDGQPALVLSETVENTGYCTYIYYYDGAVMELFAEQGLSLNAEAGQPILPAKALSMERRGERLLRITCTGESGGTASTAVFLRSGSEVTGL